MGGARLRRRRIAQRWEIALQCSINKQRHYVQQLRRTDSGRQAGTTCLNGEMCYPTISGWHVFEEGVSRSDGKSHCSVQSTNDVTMFNNDEEQFPVGKPTQLA